MPQSKRVVTKEVAGPQGEDVRLMFYADGSIRFSIASPVTGQTAAGHLGGKTGKVILTL